MSDVLIVIGSMIAFFGLDAFAYCLVIRWRNSPLWNNWPGSGYYELVRWLAGKKNVR